MKKSQQKGLKKIKKKNLAEDNILANAYTLWRRWWNVHVVGWRLALDPSRLWSAWIAALLWWWAIRARSTWPWTIAIIARPIRRNYYCWLLVAVRVWTTWFWTTLRSFWLLFLALASDATHFGLSLCSALSEKLKSK